MEAPSTIVRLYWEPEAANFASGFLGWLRGNFNTDAPQPLTGEEQKRLKQLKEWAGSGKLKRELAEEMGLTERQLARVAKDLAAKGYVTDYYLADRNKSGNVR